MYLLTAKTEAGRNWINENVQSEPWQWSGGCSLAVDHHYIEYIAEGIKEAGLVNDIEITHC